MLTGHVPEGSQLIILGVSIRSSSSLLLQVDLSHYAASEGLTAEEILSKLMFDNKPNSLQLLMRAYARCFNVNVTSESEFLCWPTPAQVLGSSHPVRHHHRSVSPRCRR